MLAYSTESTWQIRSKMKAIFLFYWHLCLLKASPERAPSSKELLFIIIGLYALLSVIVLNNTDTERSMSQIVGILSTNILFSILSTWLILSFKKVADRLVSTLIALFGCNILLTILSLPVDVMFSNLENASQQVVLLATSLWLLIFVWWLAIAGNILMHAGNMSFIQGVFLALTVEVLYIVTISKFFLS